MKMLIRVAVFCLSMVVLMGCALSESLSDDSNLLRLANSSQPLDESYEPEDLVRLQARRTDSEEEGIFMAATGTIKLRSEAAEALTALCRNAQQDGFTLYVRQGYRSYAEAAKRYDRMMQRGQTAEKPGEDDYQTGLAVTLVNEAYRSKPLDAAFGDTEEGQWLMRHSASHGFVLRYPEGKESFTGQEAEPWHLRYVGIEAAEDCIANNLCLEEYCMNLTGNAQPMPPKPEPKPQRLINPREAVPLEATGPDGDWEWSYSEPM